MKILLLTDRLAVGGAETHLWELACGLRRQGHVVALASAGGAYAERLIAAGFRHETIPLASKNPLSLLRARQGLLSLLQIQGYTVVHAHARLPAALAAPLCQRLSIPLVTTAHWVFQAGGWRRRFSQWGARCLAVSEDIRRYLIECYSLPPEQIRLTCNGVDTERFCPPTPQGAAAAGRESSLAEETAPSEQTGPLSRGGRVLLHVSRLDRGRAACAALLIRLAPRLAASGACSAIHIVGGGDREEELLREAAEVNRRLGFPFLSLFGARTDVLPFLQGADLFVGVSRAALEAMACGLPVILAGDEGYLSIFDESREAEAIRSNFCCRGAPPLSPEALARDVEGLFSDPVRMRTLGIKNRAFVCRRYSAARMVADALAAYREVQDEGGPTSASPHLATHAPDEGGDDPLATHTPDEGQNEPLTTHAPCYPKSAPSFFIAGYYGFQNGGDDALLLSLLTCLRAEGVQEITVLSHAPGQTAALFGVRAVGRRDPMGVLRALRESDCFLLGGGNLIQNETSNRSLFYYTHLLACAKRAGCRCILLGGVGGLDRRGERVAQAALSRLDAALARTPQDAARIRRLTRGRLPVRLLPDHALYLSATKRGERGGTLVICPHGRRSDDGFLRAACRLTSLHAARGGKEVALLLMYPAQDSTSLPALCRALPQARVIPHTSLSKTLALLSSADLLFSARLHPLILAAVAGLPAIGWDDGGKLRDFYTYAHACSSPPSPDGGEMLALLSPSLPPCKGQADAQPREKKAHVPLPCVSDPADALAALALPPEEAYARRYLAALRAPGMGFSFLSFLSSLSTE